MVMIGR